MVWQAEEDGSKILIESASASRGNNEGKKSPKIVLSLRQLEQLFLSTHTMLQGQNEAEKAQAATQKLNLHSSIKQFQQKESGKSRQNTNSHNVLR